MCRKMWVLQEHHVERGRDAHRRGRRSDMPAGKYGSDLIVDMLKLYGIPFASLNPGASYRGLHDSIVNYADNTPFIIQCTHEKVAVGVAHGYARATGKPMAAILHNLVGLLHGTMGIYYAYIDEAPVIVLGASGPFDTTRRRPYIDWIHTAQNQGEVLREYTKWDDQPYTMTSIPESFARAYRVATTPPYGPVYLCYDSNLQEDPLDVDVPLPNPKRLGPPELPALPPQAAERAAEMLLSAARPLVLAEMAGQNPAAVDRLIELADLVGAAVVDGRRRFNFPSTHPLDLTDTGAFEDADLILGVGVKDYERPLTRLNRTTREREWRIPEGSKIIDIGYRDGRLSAWSQDFARLMEVDLAATVDPALALGQIIEATKDRVNGNHKERIQSRKDQLRQKHDSSRKQFQEDMKKDWDSKPMTTARLSWEVWQAIKGEDWVQTGAALSGWNRKLWDWTKHYQYPGEPLGTGTQIGIGLGVALAHKGSNKLVVNIQPDGDLLFDAASLWIAAYYHIPMLVVMYNNRAYYNDWEHQIAMARHRGRNEENAYIGMDFHNPSPNFAKLAESMGWHAEGPIEDPNQLGPALERAIRHIKSTGEPSLVDAVTQFR
jgi:acetolactate synthase I/II/III large subunit